MAGLPDGNTRLKYWIERRFGEKSMFRVKKALNNNTVIAIGADNQEYLLIGKGIGFGKKVSQRIEASEGCMIYSLFEYTERGSAMDLVKGIDPVFLEIAFCFNPDSSI